MKRVNIFNCLVILFAFVFGTITAKQLPSYIVQCSRSSSDFEECSLQHAKDSLTILIKGDREYHVPALNPLEVPTVELSSGGFKMTFKDLKIYGLDSADLKKVKFDFNNKQLIIDVNFDRIGLIGQYQSDGKILILPIQGQGNFNITISRLNIHFSLKYREKESNGATYFDFYEPKVDYTLGRVYFDIGNLFEGNKDLGDATNRALNEHWEKFMESLKPVISQAIADIVLGIAQDFASIVPIQYMFIE